MKRLSLFILLTLFVMAASLFFIHYRRQVTTSSTSGCIDIPATPDYLSTGSAHDGIAAINNARQQEHLQLLRLPTNFYQLDPLQQQFILVNLERTDRGLHPLRMDVNLSQIALAYSKQLLDLHFFSHTSPISGTFEERMNSNPAIANHYSLAAENLAGNPVPGVGPIYEYMYNDSVENCGHRYNILNPALTLVGINWVHGGEYGSMSVQEFLTPAPWSPYVGTTTPNTSAPQLAISVNFTGQSSSIKYEVLIKNNADVVRITWFLDSINNPPHIGSEWNLDTHRLSHGKHTVFAYAVDGEQNYGMARYTFMT